MYISGGRVVRDAAPLFELVPEVPRFCPQKLKVGAGLFIGQHTTQNRYV